MSNAPGPNGNRAQLALTLLGVVILVAGGYVGARLSARLDVLSTGLAQKRTHIETITNIRRDARKSYVALLLHWHEPNAAKPADIRTKAQTVIAAAEKFAGEPATSPEEAKDRTQLLEKLKIWHTDIDAAAGSEHKDGDALKQQKAIDGIDKLAESILALNSKAATLDDAALVALRQTQNRFWMALGGVILLLAGGLWIWRVKTAASHRVATARLEKEMEIAATIQTSLLPPGVEVDGLDMSASMLPASEVGGDYYDVIPRAGGCWIAIGDVAGHGLTAGLVMMQAQSALATSLRKHPDAKPAEILGQVNTVLYDNIRNRMKRDEHMTLSLLRYDADGRVVVAGAHEDLVIYRAATKECETVDTRGTWLGMMRHVERHMVETELTLRPGDVLVLYTDGITEAKNDKREQYGLDRLTKCVASLAGKDANEIRDAVLGAVRGWMAQQDDDVTLVVLRYTGSGQQVVAA
jgi:hypothetical protein